MRRTDVRVCPRNGTARQLPSQISMRSRIVNASVDRISVMLFLFSAALVWVCSASAVGQDRLFPVQGAPASGTVTEMTPDKVVIEVRSGNKQEYKVSEIKKITFDDEPAGLDRARELILQDQFDQANDELKKISAASITKPLAKQDFEFYRAYCAAKMALAGTGDKAAAKNSLLQLAGKNNKSFHFYTLAQTLGELALALGKPDEAATYFVPLSKSASLDSKAKGVYWLAEADLRKGNHVEAKKKFEQLSAATASSPEMTRLKNYADVGLAVCLGRGGNSKDALTLLQSMVEKNDSSDHVLFAKIFNAQGASFVALGQTSQAIIAYLHTDLLFFADSELHAEALYYLTVLWPKVNQPQRAQETRQRLTTKYPSSTWANKK